MVLFEETAFIRKVTVSSIGKTPSLRNTLDGVQKASAPINKILLSRIYPPHVRLTKYSFKRVHTQPTSSVPAAPALHLLLLQQSIHAISSLNSSFATILPQPSYRNGRSRHKAARYINPHPSTASSSSTLAILSDRVQKRTDGSSIATPERNSRPPRPQQSRHTKSSQYSKFLYPQKKERRHILQINIYIWAQYCHPV